MTEVEITTLLSTLTETAKTLNKKSDSVNKLIDRFQETLREANVGVEVWPVTLETETWFEDDADGETRERGECGLEIGFAKNTAGEWVLASRFAYYCNEEYVNQYSFSHADAVTPLLQASRSTRIKALTHFAEIIKALTAEAAKAVKAIEQAEKFVTSPPPKPLTPEPSLSEIANSIIYNKNK